MHYVSLQIDVLSSGREGHVVGSGTQRLQGSKGREFLGKAKIQGFAEEVQSTKALFISSHILLGYHGRWVLSHGQRIFFSALLQNS